MDCTYVSHIRDAEDFHAFSRYEAACGLRVHPLLSDANFMFSSVLSPPLRLRLSTEQKVERRLRETGHRATDTRADAGPCRRLMLFRR